MASNRGYEDCMAPRRKEFSNFLYTGRAINAKLAFVQKIKPTPQSHKEGVLKSVKIQELLVKLSQHKGVPKSDLEKQVRLVLDEIGYEKNLLLIRWLGYVLIKILDQCLYGLYINTATVLKVKSEMGNCPVIFVPSHRSYADFILMSYVCFHYDIAIPEIAAGMDFHGMVGIGTMLRNTGAFFMRRSYNDDSLYWTTFKQYIYQLVTKGDLPIEFFIEGTRSRSNKSLTPKYGLMSMIMKALFLSEVPDIYFVPINISYDRILEESLFAFELLGVPKPKESTAGFFKSLKILKENFGSIYFTFDEPISAKEFLGQKFFETMNNNNNLHPLHLREITDQQKALIPPLAHQIVYRQQKNGIITAINLISIILNNNLNSQTPLSSNDLKVEVLWLKNVLESFGGHVDFPGGLDRSIKDTFRVHNNLLEVKNEEVNLIWNKVVLVRLNPSKFKAHPLKDVTMTETIPYVMLQLYINPVLHYLIDAAILVAILKCNSQLSKDRLFEDYHFLRYFFAIEFVTFETREEQEFEFALKTAIDLNLVTFKDNYELGENQKLQTLLINSIQPFILSYLVVCNVLQRVPKVCDEKTILKNAQIVLENAILEKKQFVHPYSLNLDSLTNCLSTLVLNKNLIKLRRDNKTVYEINVTSLEGLQLKLRNYLSTHLEFNFNILTEIMPQHNL